MLRRALHDMTGQRIHATDGDLGHVHDVYVDDGQWRVRYFHVDTGDWFLGRHVLLAPTIVESIDWDGGRIAVAISREAVRSSPDIDSHKPVSRQHEPQWQQYVQLHMLLIEMRGHEVVASPVEQTKNDPHLWRARTLRHYGVETREKELGRVDDLLVAPDEWTIRYIADYLAFLCPGHVSQPPEW